jgi:acyl dehydratase
MAFLLRHLVSQRKVIAAMAEVAVRDLWRPVERGPARSAPGPEVVARVRAPSLALVRDYVRHVGGDPSAYAGHGAPIVPPHLFPQWSVPLLARALCGVPYRIAAMLNGGCRLAAHAPIPAGAALTVTARLVDVRDDGRRAVLHQRVVTGTRTHPAALVADLYGIVPSSPGSGAVAPAPHKPTAAVPTSAREIASWTIRKDDGLAFALLTGDFNPVHWLAPYARAFGVGRPILHGFAIMARAMESLARVVAGGDVGPVAVVDVRFSRPLPLGVRVGLYLDAGTRTLYVADAPGGRPYLLGSFEERKKERTTDG